MNKVKQKGHAQWACLLICAIYAHSMRSFDRQFMSFRAFLFRERAAQYSIVQRSLDVFRVKIFCKMEGTFVSHFRFLCLAGRFDGEVAAFYAHVKVLFLYARKFDVKSE